ncbi:hypothetical protein [Pseudomonas marginalis]|uniref:hypothetical protein n=1 Tax=Pseudomonas marginalis TaxID=298 RepID=UPI001279A975|nr:hypothetical protein [Pseudomonas marginalis]KAA8555060.1 hypothetical protein FX984_01678 [Pseudomonas marginalis]
MTDINSYIAEYGRRRYFRSLLLAIDQFANALMWGYVDETLSSRAYRCRNNKKRWLIAERVINCIFWRDRQGTIRHCQMAYYAELAREHLPKYE